MSQFAVMLTSPRQAHEALTELWHTIKPILRRGAPSELRWATVNRHRRSQLRKRFHGPVLRQIAEQVWLHDPASGKHIRYHPLAWKLYFAELFLPAEADEIVDEETGELEPVLRRRSTERLSDDEFAVYIERVIAWAVTELAVEFDFKEDDHG